MNSKKRTITILEGGIRQSKSRFHDGVSKGNDDKQKDVILL